jgi:hypothetical protein
MIPQEIEPSVPIDQITEGLLNVVDNVIEDVVPVLTVTVPDPAAISP